MQANQATERCERCGYDLPAGADACPGCGPARASTPPLAARQVAGLALPTRSVHELSTVRPVRDRHHRPVRGPSWAPDLLSVTVLLGVVTVLARLTALVLDDGRALANVSGTLAPRADDVVLALVWATLGAAVLTVLAAVGRAVRVRRRRQDQPDG